MRELLRSGEQFVVGPHRIDALTVSHETVTSTVDGARVTAFALTSREVKQRVRSGGQGVSRVLDGSPGVIRLAGTRRLLLQHDGVRWSTAPRWRGGLRLTRDGESTPVSEISLRRVLARDDVSVGDLAAVVVLVATGLYVSAGGLLGIAMSHYRWGSEPLMR